MSGEQNSVAAPEPAELDAEVVSIVVLRDGRRCVLRRARPGDSGRIYDYFARLSPISRAFFHPHPFSVADARRIACDGTSARIYRLLALDGQTGVVAGYAFYEAAVETGGVPVLGIGIADDYQGAGLGRAMMEALIAEARRTHREGINLTVYKNNARAIALYQSLGFRIVGETADRNQHTMYLRLET